MPQSHPTTGPVRFYHPYNFLLVRPSEAPITSVLFSWSHQAMGPVRLDTAVHLWFGRILRRTPRVPRAMPLRASYGPRTGIFNVFHILRDRYGARKGPTRQSSRKPLVLWSVASEITVGPVKHASTLVRRASEEFCGTILSFHVMW